jgi:predicted NBD/HSP70 family sugar kinase
MYLAIDIGGTKTLVALFDKQGSKTESFKFKTPPLYHDFLDHLANVVAKFSTNKFTGCCIAVPGRVLRHEGIGVAFGNLAWSNIPIRDNVTKIVDCPVVIENDANLAGLSEARLNPDAKRVLYVTISTGIGGVIVQDGQIEKTTEDSEIGHLLLEHDGQLMRWEDFASGKAIVKKFGLKASEIDKNDNSKWYIISRNIALGLIDVIATLTPSLVIIGGGVGSHFDKFGNRLKEELKIYDNPLISVPPVIMATRPEEAVVYGCYELVKDYHAKESSPRN